MISAQLFHFYLIPPSRVRCRPQLKRSEGDGPCFPSPPSGFPSSQDNDGCKRRDSRHPLRGRSPVRRDPHAALPASHAGFEGRGRSFSPDRENSYTYQQLQQRSRSYLLMKKSHSLFCVLCSLVRTTAQWY